MIGVALWADALAKWLPPYGLNCQVHHLEARVAGGFRMSFTNFTTGNGHSFGGEYLELVPNERIRYTDKFDDPNLPGEMRVTIRVRPSIRSTWQTPLDMLTNFWRVQLQTAHIPG